ncbi:MAG: endonuclease/exonuclease/phosphatase family protein [Candidatus Brocadiia bacterium]
MSGLEPVRTPQDASKPDAALPAWKTALRPVFAVSFCGACLGVLALLLMFHAPAVNAPIFYFTTRPAFVWFGMLLPFLAVGALAMRRRWFVLGCAFWVVSLLACEDALAWVRPFHESARTKFEASQMAYLSFSSARGNEIEVLDVPLRIVTWNVRSGTLGAAQAVAQLAELRPDVALLEEFVWGDHSGMLDAFRASPYFRGYQVTGPTAHPNGIAIVSRFPITEPKGVLLPWNSAVWQVHFAPDRRITCVALHLSAPELKTQVLRGWTWKGLRKALESRRRELETVREMAGLQVDGSPLLMVGDFNVPSNYPDLSIATAGMKDAFATKGFGWGKTAPANFRAVRPDMIFVPPDATVFDAFAMPTDNSDHCPVVAEISIRVPRLATMKLPATKEDLPAAPKLTGPKQRVPQSGRP